MTFLPWLGVMPEIDQAIDTGLGVVGAVVGQPYNVYRRTNSTNSSVISGSPLFTNFPANIRKSSKVAIENQTFDLLVFIANCDRRQLQEEDFLVTQGYLSDGGIFYLAQMRPMAETLFVRTETLSFITRPFTDAGAVSQQPEDEFAVVQTGYGATRIGIEKYLVLTSGMYSFSEEATSGASVPVGIQPLNRVRDGQLPKNSPTKQYRTHHLIFAPNLPGVVLEVQDRINANNGDRYEIMEVHSTGQVGFDGNVIIADRLWS
jgi:hypothetical protein